MGMPAPWKGGAEYREMHGKLLGEMYVDGAIACYECPLGRQYCVQKWLEDDCPYFGGLNGKQLLCGATGDADPTLKTYYDSK